MTTYTLKDITRPSGGFAMLAVDQREAMRLMFAAAGTPTTFPPLPTAHRSPCAAK